MIQCSDCEFYDPTQTGAKAFKCDPFGSIKEPQCLAKWQLIKTELLLETCRQQLNYYNRMSPMQEKMFRIMQREIDTIDETESWKYDDVDDDDLDHPWE